jgi:hypothetical protein
MKIHDSIAKSLASLVTVGILLSYGPQTLGQGTATLQGTIFADGGEAAADGAILHAANLRTGDIYSSVKTGSDGEFVISDLPPAAYELAIEQDGGLYLTKSAVQLTAGEQRKVHVAINAQAAPDPETAAKKKKKGGGIWDKPWLATLVVVGGAFVVGWAISSADSDSQGLPSPFTQ